MPWRPNGVLIIHIKGYSALSTDKEKVFHELLLPRVIHYVDDFRSVGTWRFHRMSILCVGNDLVRLCQAALDIRDVVKTVKWEKYLGKPLDFRVSVHIGEAPSHEDLFGKGRLVIASSIAEVDQFPPAPDEGVWVTDDVARRLPQDHDDFALDDFGPTEMAFDGLPCHLFYLRRTDEDAQVRSDETLSLRDEFEKTLTSSTRERGLDIVAGIAISAGEVLMVSRETRPGLSEWFFPSGEFYPQEDHHERAAQEVRIASGMRCTPDKDVWHSEKAKDSDRQIYYCAMHPTGSRSIRNANPSINQGIAWVNIATALQRLHDRASPEVLKFLSERVG